MHKNFSVRVEKLHASFGRLISQAPCRDAKFPNKLPKAGVYLFSEGQRHLYVGRTNDLRGRFGRHCNAGATHRMASFAFRLAREQTGNLKATYKAGEGSRDHLMEDEEFKAAFIAAKKRIRAMEFRWVEEVNPIQQCLLEIYCAVALETPYNDFDNH